MPPQRGFGYTPAFRMIAELLARGPMDAHEAVNICCQIAEGLEAAHENGIIHRDLKPANEMITPGGKVKILDFGLARALRDPAVSEDLSHSPEAPEQETKAGTVLGTKSYMSPEQAKGKPVDRRADIWAFGCVLYECLTGKRVFQGDTVTETIAAILKEDPDWQALPASVPGNVRAVLRRCLQKDPSHRLRDVGDARIEIGEPSLPPSEPVPAARRVPLGWLGAGAGVISLAGLAIALALMGYFQPVSPEPIVSTIKLEPGHWLAGPNREAELQRPSRAGIAISKDGSFIVYRAIADSIDRVIQHPQIEIKMESGPKPQLYLRKIGQAAAKPIAGAEGGISPFLSPDNRWVGFWADGQLKKVAIEGGVSAPLCKVPYILGADWSIDNRVVFEELKRLVPAGK